MQPSSDQGSGGSNPLRRYGPIIGIGVIILIVIALLVTSGGDDDDDTATDDSSDTTGDDGATDDDTGDDGVDTGDDSAVRPGITFAQAEEEGLDVTFPETCDTERGTVAIPWFFAPDCYADYEDNGGATHSGVTEDTITLVYYLSPEVDPTLDFITGPIANDDTPAQIQATAQGYIDMFNSMYQLYGRQVDVKFLNASGPSEDEVAAVADAQRAVEEMGAFAVIGGPVLTNEWTKAIADQGVICLCGGGSQEFLDQRAPYVYSVGMGGAQNNAHAAEYVSKKLAGKPASHAGDPALVDTERTFGHLYISTSEESEKNADLYERLLDEQGVELTERVGYDLAQLITSPEVATNAIAKFKAAGVTSILLQGDPVGPSNFTQEATSQEYFPEWVVTGGALVDTNVFGRVFDQQQWSHAFGITGGGVHLDPQLSASFRLYEWFHGEEPPAFDTSPVILPGISLFFAALQAAGPDLDPDAFRNGLFEGDRTADATTQPSLSYGDKGLWDALGEPSGCDTDEPMNCDWNGVDDMTEWWWDADEVGPDELDREGAGMMRYANGGVRYLPGTWDTEDRAFVEEGSLVLLEEPPAGEEDPEYPSPAG